MAERDFYEKLSIRDSAKSLKRYGSTSTHTKRQENLIKHVIVPTDTLQGIALKYGVTTEQIRRTNRLWATDSLFLRQYLMIPIGSDTPVNSPVEPVPSNNNSNSNKSSTDIEECTIDSFLSSIDSSIAHTKKEVKRAQGNSEFIADSDLDVGAYSKRKAMSRMRQSSSAGSRPSSASQPFNVRSSTQPDILNNSSSYQQYNCNTSHTTVPMVITQTGRKVRTSLQRLEQQQDEMFEL